jgi:murein DD-endopeptidase MepM/ murein hydrolase activator NlpD
MRHVRGAALGALTTSILFVVCQPALALAGEPGGAQAPSEQSSGGSQYGIPVHAASLRPVVTELSVPSTAVPGRPPRVVLRIDEKGVGTVNLTVAVNNLTTRRLAVSAKMGWVHTGRAIAVVWPKGASLPAGTYHVSLSAHDHHGGNLLRTAHSSGVATLTVKAPPPTPAPAPASAPEPTLEAGVPTPAQTAADGAVFPVRGAHNFGGSENRFGAARSGHIHQGQDVLTSEGTPVVVPFAGTITSTAFQAGGAGYYAVEHTTTGFDFMFAHCEANSFAVTEGEAVVAGQALCKAGQTGDATAPHLHFEMWVGGWQAKTGHPIDPLPYLEAWDADGAS